MLGVRRQLGRASKHQKAPNDDAQLATLVATLDHGLVSRRDRRSQSPAASMSAMRFEKRLFSSRKHAIILGTSRGFFAARSAAAAN